LLRCQDALQRLGGALQHLFQRALPHYPAALGLQVAAGQRAPAGGQDLAPPPRPPPPPRAPGPPPNPVGAEESVPDPGGGGRPCPAGPHRCRCGRAAAGSCGTTPGGGPGPRAPPGGPARSAGSALVDLGSWAGHPSRAGRPPPADFALSTLVRCETV